MCLSLCMQCINDTSCLNNRISLSVKLSLMIVFNMTLSPKTLNFSLKASATDTTPNPPLASCFTGLTIAMSTSRNPGSTKADVVVFNKVIVLGLEIDVVVGMAVKVVMVVFVVNDVAPLFLWRVQ